MKPDELHAAFSRIKWNLVVWWVLGILVFGFAMLPLIVYGIDCAVEGAHRAGADTPLGLRIAWPVVAVTFITLLVVPLNWRSIEPWFRNTHEWPWDRSLRRARKAIKS